VKADRYRQVLNLLENALVRGVNRRMDILIVRLWRYTQLVEICRGSGSLETTCRGTDVRGFLLGLRLGLALAGRLAYDLGGRSVEVTGTFA
jgi:hypothetical protein